MKEMKEEGPIGDGYLPEDQKETQTLTVKPSDETLLRKLLYRNFHFIQP